MSLIRDPAVSGLFYPNDMTDLRDVIMSCNAHKNGPNDARASESKVYGVVCPHAGYAYSGPTACHAYRVISEQNPETVFIVGPNHYGIGKNAATMTDTLWKTPFGTVAVDSEAAKELSTVSNATQIDYHSHSRDHSIEVQIPMLQFVFERFEIVPVILRSQDIETAKDVGNAIARVAKKKKSVVVASSDFTHYEEESFARRQDMRLIEPILDMDVEGFYDTLESKRVSACGYGAIASVMTACSSLGAKKARLLNYSTSADTTQDYKSVVGYASMEFV